MRHGTIIVLLAFVAQARSRTILLLAFVAQAQSRKPVTRSHSGSALADNLVENLVDRTQYSTSKLVINSFTPAIKVFHFHHADLDKTTFGKLGHLAKPSPRMKLRHPVPLLTHPYLTRMKPRHPVPLLSHPYLTRSYLAPPWVSNWQHVRRHEPPGRHVHMVACMDRTPNMKGRVRAVELDAPPAICGERSMDAVAFGARRAYAQVSNNHRFRNWDLAAALVGQSHAEGPFALIVLNTPLPAKRMPELWDNAAIRISCDGAIEKLQLLEEEQKVMRTEKYRTSDYKPHYMVGDFDSAPEDVVQFYEDAGARRVKIESQDNTDLDKAFAILQNDHPGIRNVMIVGEFAGHDGRVDHGFGNYNSMLRHSKDCNIVAISQRSLAVVLPADLQHTLLVGKLSSCPSHCGLIPLFGPVNATTTSGFKWNVNGHEMRFGSLVSTSNVVDSTELKVKSNGPLLFTLTLPMLPPSC